MTSLTEDEFTVLAIAAEGESMMPLGRWEQPVERLVELGYLERTDKFNNYITATGRIAMHEYQKGADTALGQALVKANGMRTVYRQHGEELAGRVVEMAQQMTSVTG